MKRLSYLLSTLLLMTLVVFTGCKDDAPEETPEQVQTRLLTAGPFTVSTVTLNPTTDWTFDGTSTISFNGENKTFTITGNTALPNLANSDIAFPASGTWAWTETDNFNKITLTAGSESIPLTITSLDDNNLVFSYTGSPVKATETAEVTVTATK